jgi:putative membrane protein
MHAMHYHGYRAMGFGHGLWAFFLHVLGFLLLVAVIIIIIRCVAGKPGRWRYFVRPAALDILKERYAKGEIDKEEFENTKKDLLDSEKNA